MQQAAWQERFASAFENISHGEREAAAGALRTLVKALNTGSTSAGDKGFAISGNVDVRADHGSAAALRIESVTLNNHPPLPGAHQV